MHHLSSRQVWDIVVLRPHLAYPSVPPSRRSQIYMLHSTSPPPHPRGPTARQTRNHPRRAALEVFPIALQGPLDRCGGELRPVSLCRYRVERNLDRTSSSARCTPRIPANPASVSGLEETENRLAAVMLQVAALFYDRPRLLEGFNRFLLDEFRIHLTSPFVIGLQKWVEVPGGEYSLQYFSWHGPGEYGHGGWAQK
ncbi:hypothetical protein C8Q80DRAFT_1271878 [Daedaleopsis nitida]|nr:hypothetical protein C8Q80DRAFT_1271878 [Daedaleopsis nitida]